MVSDSDGELPSFAEGDLVVAPPASVRAQIHIQKEFNVNEIVDVVRSGAHNQRVSETVAIPTPLWFGAVFFARTKLKTDADLRRIWKSAISKVIKGKRIDPKLFPDCLAIIDGPTLLVDKPTLPQTTLTVRACDCGKASPAVFLNDLSANVPFSGKDLTRRGEWFQMLSKLCKKVIFTETYECTQ